MVESRRHGDTLGVIKWYGPWRQYCFYPEPGCVFNSDCLRDIAGFCFKLMQEWRYQKTTKKEDTMTASDSEARPT
jgi:hypothetical protein